MGVELFLVGACSLCSLSDACFHMSVTGMNDILPMPFTKQGLLDMLEVRILVILFGSADMRMK